MTVTTETKKNGRTTRRTGTAKRGNSAARVDAKKSGSTVRATATARKSGGSRARADVKRSGNTVSGRFTLQNLPVFDAAEAKKPLFAFVGVADLAIEQAKEVPADVTAEARKVQELLASTSKQVPVAVKALPGNVKSQLDSAGDRAVRTYGRLARRGERLVARIRRQPATQAAVAEGKDALRKAEATATSARRFAEAGEKAVEGAASKIG